uniref:RNA polymerase beta'' subunit n=1 Tax=Edaphochlamys debaryana TaxID=47281 RepID=UPI0022A71F1F|nr:RNA polymerase beta'' subunit [Edaphochlamys debaryana]UZS90726.1 RNA polymerase beta'' subunit [Edaphochlamys debaryana]
MEYCVTRCNPRRAEGCYTAPLLGCKYPKGGRVSTLVEAKGALTLSDIGGVQPGSPSMPAPGGVKSRGAHCSLLGQKTFSPSSTSLKGDVAFGRPPVGGRKPKGRRTNKGGCITSYYLGMPYIASRSINTGAQKEGYSHFFNFTFDKGRLKNLVSWTLENYGQYKTVELLENLKKTGFEYATKAGISLGIDDLKIPPKKKLLLLEAEKLTKLTIHQYQRADITAVERFQRLIDTWHRTSEQLKQEVISYFEETDILNPVYMMAFSGARGNISQVRQLVGMRGLMSDPQGQIIDFPIRSNFREGLTLTEYIISSYGARKGIVDTALRTANAGYLTRRLVDVAQHVIISHYDCGTQKGIFLTDMKEGNKILVSTHSRIIGRVLARDIYKPNTNIPIALRNQEISNDLAFEITKTTNKVFVRSSLTCNTNKLLCQLCYGWSLAQGNLVSVAETVGVIAAQSIGEPGTQLTMRTFHTGGVFSGDISDEIRAPYNGFVYYSHTIPGILIRALDGKILFLTKSDGTLILSRGPLDLVDNQSNNYESKELLRHPPTVETKGGMEVKKYKIPAYTVLFVRNGESVVQKQVIAQITTISTKPNMRDTAELVIKSDFEGLFYSKNLKIFKQVIGPKPKYTGELKQDIKMDPKAMEIVVKARGWNFAWVLSGKRYETPLLLKAFPLKGDLITSQTVITRHCLYLGKLATVINNLTIKQKTFVTPSPKGDVFHTSTKVDALRAKVSYQNNKKIQLPLSFKGRGTLDTITTSKGHLDGDGNRGRVLWAPLIHKVEGAMRPLIRLSTSLKGDVFHTSTKVDALRAKVDKEGLKPQGMLASLKNNNGVSPVKHKLFFLNLQKIRFSKIAYFYFFNQNVKNNIKFLFLKTVTSKRQDKDNVYFIHGQNRTFNYSLNTNVDFLTTPTSLKPNYTLKNAIAVKRIKGPTFLFQFFSNTPRESKIHHFFRRSNQGGHFLNKIVPSWMGTRFNKPLHKEGLALGGRYAPFNKSLGYNCYTASGQGLFCKSSFITTLASTSPLGVPKAEVRKSKNTKQNIKSKNNFNTQKEFFRPLPHPLMVEGACFIHQRWKSVKSPFTPSTYSAPDGVKRSKEGGKGARSVFEQPFNYTLLDTKKTLVFYKKLYNTKKKINFSLSPFMAGRGVQSTFLLAKGQKLHLQKKFTLEQKNWYRIKPTRNILAYKHFTNLQFLTFKTWFKEGLENKSNFLFDNKTIYDSQKIFTFNFDNYSKNLRKKITDCVTNIFSCPLSSISPKGDALRAKVESTSSLRPSVDRREDSMFTHYGGSLTPPKGGLETLRVLHSNASPLGDVGVKAFFEYDKINHSMQTFLKSRKQIFKHFKRNKLKPTLAYKSLEGTMFKNSIHLGAPGGVKRSKGGIENLFTTNYYTNRHKNKNLDLAFVTKDLTQVICTSPKGDELLPPTVEGKIALLDLGFSFLNFVTFAGDSLKNKGGRIATSSTSRLPFGLRSTEGKTRCLHTKGDVLHTKKIKIKSSNICYIYNYYQLKKVISSPAFILDFSILGFLKLKTDLFISYNYICNKNKRTQYLHRGWPSAKNKLSTLPSTTWRRQKGTSYQQGTIGGVHFVYIQINPPFKLWSWHKEGGMCLVPHAQKNKNLFNRAALSEIPHTEDSSTMCIPQRGKPFLNFLLSNSTTLDYILKIEKQKKQIKWIKNNKPRFASTVGGTSLGPSALLPPKVEVLHSVTQYYHRSASPLVRCTSPLGDGDGVESQKQQVVQIKNKAIYSSQNNNLFSNKTGLPVSEDYCFAPGWSILCIYPKGERGRYASDLKNGHASPKGDAFHAKRTQQNFPLNGVGTYTPKSILASTSPKGDALRAKVETLRPSVDRREDVLHSSASPLGYVDGPSPFKGSKRKNFLKLINKDLKKFLTRVVYVVRSPLGGDSLSQNRIHSYKVKKSFTDKQKIKNNSPIKGRWPSVTMIPPRGMNVIPKQKKDLLLLPKNPGFTLIMTNNIISQTFNFSQNKKMLQAKEPFGSLPYSSRLPSAFGQPKGRLDPPTGGASRREDEGARFTFRGCKYSIKNKILYTKLPFFDLSFKNPSYYYTYTATSKFIGACVSKYSKSPVKGNSRSTPGLLTKKGTHYVPKQPCLNICFELSLPCTSTSPKGDEVDKVPSRGITPNHQRDPLGKHRKNGWIGHVRSETNYFSPFEGEFFYIKTSKNYLDLNPYENLQTGLINLNYFTSPKGDALRANTSTSPKRDALRAKTKQQDATLSKTPRKGGMEKQRVAMFKYYLKNRTKQKMLANYKNWTRFNLILTKKDLLTLTYKHQQVPFFANPPSQKGLRTSSYEQKKQDILNLNNLFKKNVKANNRYKTVSGLNKENIFNHGYIFSLKNQWFSQKLKNNCKNYKIKINIPYKAVKTKKSENKKLTYLFTPTTKNAFNSYWLNMKQKNVFTKNKVGFFVLKGNTFFNESTKLTTKKNFSVFNSKIYNYNGSKSIPETQGEDSFLTDTRYLDLKNCLELKKIHINKNYLKIKPLLDKIQFLNIYTKQKITANFLFNGNVQSQEHFIQNAVSALEGGTSRFTPSGVPVGGCALPKGLYIPLWGKKGSMLNKKNVQLFTQQATLHPLKGTHYVPAESGAMFGNVAFCQMPRGLFNPFGIRSAKGGDTLTNILSTQNTKAQVKHYSWVSSLKIGFTMQKIMQNKQKYYIENFKQKNNSNLDYMLNLCFSGFYTLVLASTSPSPKGDVLRTKGDEKSNNPSNTQGISTNKNPSKQGDLVLFSGSSFFVFANPLSFQRWAQQSKTNLPSVDRREDEALFFRVGTRADGPPSCDVLLNCFNFCDKKYFSFLNPLRLNSPADWLHFLAITTEEEFWLHSTEAGSALQQFAVYLKKGGWNNLMRSSLCTSLCNTVPSVDRREDKHNVIPEGCYTARRASPKGDVLGTKKDTQLSTLVEATCPRAFLYQGGALPKVQSALDYKINLYNKKYNVQYIKFSTIYQSPFTVDNYSNNPVGFVITGPLCGTHYLTVLASPLVCKHRVFPSVDRRPKGRRDVEALELAPFDFSPIGCWAKRKQLSTPNIPYIRNLIYSKQNLSLTHPLKGTHDVPESSSEFFKVLKKSGQLIQMNKQKITIRLGQPLVISPRSIIHAAHGDFIRSKTTVITLTYQQLKTGDIVQGIPKIEQLFEARTTKRGRLFRDNVTNLLTGLFLNYFVKSTYLLRQNLLTCRVAAEGQPGVTQKTSPLNKGGAGASLFILPGSQAEQELGQVLTNKQNQTIVLALALQWSVKQSFYKIQQIIVDGILRVYRSQGVTIADKHVEIIVKQMTSKVRVINSSASKLTDYAFSLKNINRGLNSSSELEHKISTQANVKEGAMHPQFISKVDVLNVHPLKGTHFRLNKTSRKGVMENKSSLKNTRNQKKSSKKIQYNASTSKTIIDARSASSKGDVFHTKVDIRRTKLGDNQREFKLLEKLLSNKLEGPTGLFPGEIVDIDFVENINVFLLKEGTFFNKTPSTVGGSKGGMEKYPSNIRDTIEPIKYEPIVLGITRASLEVESFLSAASFQQTTRVLSQAALYKKKDFLKGLKENIIIGNLIPAGTGYLSSLNF